VPEIANMLTLKQAIAQDDAQTKIVFYEGGGEPLKSIINENAKSVSIYIGPEGGFDEAEVEQIVASGAQVATLGARILRTQTAPVASLTAIMLLTNNLE
jgi:16S rRNA (uracil1498-N3)-methyltransferase